MTRARTGLIVAALVGGVLFWIADLLLFRLGFNARPPLIFSGSFEDLLARLFILFIALGLGIPLLLDWRRRSEQQMKTGLRRLEILNRIVTLANRAEDETRLLTQVLKEVLDLFGFDGGAVYVFDEATGDGDMVCSLGLPREFIDEVRHVRTDGLPSVIRDTVFQRHRPLLTSDPQVLSRPFQELSGMVSAAFIPLFIQDRIIGTLNVASRAHREFKAEDRLLLLSIGQEIGTSIARLQTEQALSESEQRYRTVVEKSTNWLLIHRHGRLLFVNPTLARVAGYATCEEMLASGKGALDYVHPDSRALVAERMRQSMSSDTALPMTEEKFLMPDGRIYIGEVVAQRIVFDGEPAAMVVIRDITEHHQTESRLRTALRQLEDIVNFLPDATFVVNQKGEVIAWNRAIERMTGVAARDMIGRGDHAYTVPFYGHKRPALVDLLFRKDDEYERKYQDLHRTNRILAGEAFTPGVYGGKGATVWATASPLYNDQGEVIGAIESIRDITDRKRAEEALREAERISREYAVELAAANEELRLANERLREIDLQKSEFLASVAHELRTPLATTHGAVENLLTGMAGDITEQQQLLLAIVNRNTARLSRLIDNLLELSRIDARQFTLRRSRTDLAELVRQAVDNFRPLVDRKNIDLTLLLPPASVPVEVDGDKIIQVVTNFLDNALRYARARVEVSLGLEPGLARIAVLDDGPGVPSKDLSRLFRRYSRIDATNRKSHIGLGLSIVKAIAEAHGGRAEAANVEQPFPGTRFSFILPRPPFSG